MHKRKHLIGDLLIVSLVSIGSVIIIANRHGAGAEPESYPDTQAEKEKARQGLAWPFETLKAHL